MNWFQPAHKKLLVHGSDIIHLKDLIWVLAFCSIWLKAHVTAQTCELGSTPTLHVLFLLFKLWITVQVGTYDWLRQEMQGCRDSWGFADRGSSNTNGKQVFGKFLSHNVYCSLPVPLYWNVSRSYNLNKCNKIQSITHSNQYLHNIIQN